MEVILPEYFRGAQNGNIETETLNELTDTLKEMYEYSRSCKLKIPGRAS